MSDRVLIGTRKGLVTLNRTASGEWKLGPIALRGMPVTMVLQDPRDGTMLAGLNLGHFGVKLHRSRDGGHSFEEIEAPRYPAAEDGDGASLSLIWALEAGHAPGEIWAGTIPGGLFHSLDSGDSWQLVESLWNRPERPQWFGGGYDEAGIHSIAVHPTNPNHITIGISCGGVWVSEDAGVNWECRTKGMWAAYMPPEQRENPIIQDPHRLVQCPAHPDHLWVAHHNAVFRSVNAGYLWEDIANVPPSTFGFTTCVHPQDPDTAWFVPAESDQVRLPVDGAMTVARTRDGGATFDSLGNGLPSSDAYHIVYRHGMDIDSSGQRLVMGSTTGGLWITENQGDDWTCISQDLPMVYCVRFV